MCQSRGVALTMNCRPSFQSIARAAMNRSAAFTPLHRRACERCRQLRGARALGALKRPKVRAPIRVLAVLGLSLLLSLTLRAEDWPQWRGPNRDGAWNESGIMESFPPGGLKISWRVPVGRGWSSPVVGQGRVYVTDVALARPTAKERVLCFDEANGKLLWTHQYAVDYPEWAFDPNAGGPRATPIARDGSLFTLGALGHLFCLNAAKGVVVWGKNLAKEYGVKEFTGITASPLIEDELLILQICAKPAACVVAFDKNSGKEAWRALDDSFTYSSPIIVTA